MHFNRLELESMDAVDMIFWEELCDVIIKAENKNS